MPWDTQAPHRKSIALTQGDLHRAACFVLLWVWESVQTLQETGADPLRDTSRPSERHKQLLFWAWNPAGGMETRERQSLRLREPPACYRGYWYQDGRSESITTCSNYSNKPNRYSFKISLFWDHLNYSNILKQIFSEEYIFFVESLLLLISFLAFITTLGQLHF